MKRCMQKCLAWLLVFMLLLGCLSVSLGEEADVQVPAVVEEPAAELTEAPPPTETEEPLPTEAPAVDVPSALPPEAPSPAPAEEPSVSPEPDPTPTAAPADTMPPAASEPEAVPDVVPVADSTASPVFSSGYAVTLRQTALLNDSGAALGDVAEGSVVFAVSRTDEGTEKDRFWIRLNDGVAAWEGYVYAVDLRPLSESELPNEDLPACGFTPALVLAETEAASDEPTTTPAMGAPTAAPPATDAPVTDAPATDAPLAYAVLLQDVSLTGGEAAPIALLKAGSVGIVEQDGDPVVLLWNDGTRQIRETMSASLVRVLSAEESPAVPPECEFLPLAASKASPELTLRLDEQGLLHCQSLWEGLIASESYYLYRNGIQIAAQQGQHSAAFPIPADGLYSVQYVAFDGVQWHEGWAEISAVLPSARAALAIDELSVSADSTGLIHIAMTTSGGTGLTGTCFAIYLNDKLVQVWSGNSLMHDFAVTASGLYVIQAVATDAQGNAILWATQQVQLSAPTVLEVTSVSLTAQDGMLTCSATTAHGYPIASMMYALYRDNALVQIDTVTSPSHTFQATAAGVYYVQFVAFDGVTWAGKYSDSVSVSAPPKPQLLEITDMAVAVNDETGTIAVAAVTAHGQPLVSSMFCLYYNNAQIAVSVNPAQYFEFHVQQSGLYAIQYIAFDGVTWVTRWETATLTIVGPVDYDLEIETLTLTPDENTGKITAEVQTKYSKPITAATYVLYYAGQPIETITGDALRNTFATARFGFCAVHAVITDGKQTAEKWETVTVASQLTLSDLTATSSSGSTTCQVTVNAGVGVAYVVTFVLRDAAGAILARYDGQETRHVFSNVGDTTGGSVQCVVTDGTSWPEAWATITQSIVNYRALMIGQSYQGTSSKLNGTVNDAKAMATLASLTGGTPYSVSRRTDLSAAGILSAITSTFASATSDDVSLFFYSGHGMSGGYLIGTDFRSLSPYRLRQQLDTIPGTKIVIIDACYSGAVIGKDGTAAASEEFASSFNSSIIRAFASAARSSTDLADSTYYVITAASSQQISMEGYLNPDGAGYYPMGYFTYGLTSGCGWNAPRNSTCSKYADGNGDSILTLDEIYTYAKATASRYNEGQTAQVYPSGSSMPVFVY